MTNFANNTPFSKELIAVLKEHGTTYHHSSGEQLLYHDNTHTETYILLSGLVKLFIEYENKKILLYHLEGSKACIVSHANLFNDYLLEFSSVVIQDSVIITISNEKAVELRNTYPEFEKVMICSYSLHYTSILGVIKQFITESLESRLFNYLKLKSSFLNSLEIKIPIQEISTDLNFSREAISRGLKKLESNNQIIRKTRSVVLVT
ncbi:Crp/Fnr family transcriptional regulator [Aquimarina sp. 2201CG5-10]|uniref:Crp/Fnr family transcriptional regulator n=1 Tax=Aquimarina callyspongiae TaxID=3098150 RepID=UPI002AB350E8|nr:Crp/Fnr family transcriptional regulator [Aquimarina sp. 2201CG5-10]MDY8135750.1 Crp/Fnr family transcriptional regulator [Aquimarina sp. 2201CG5-10]